MERAFSIDRDKGHQGGVPIVAIECVSVALSLSLSLSHTHTHSLTLSLFLTHTLSFS